MSKAKYMEEPRKDSTLTVVVAVEALTAYIFRITNNEKQFPKAYRYTLSKNLRNTCLKLNKYVYRGCVLRAYTSKEYKRVQKHQNKAYNAIVDLKCLINIAMTVTKIANPEYVVKLYEDVTDAFNHWVKNTNRSYRRAKWREHLTQEDYWNFKQKYIDDGLHKKTKDRDSDGFIVLKRVG